MGAALAASLGGGSRLDFLERMVLLVRRCLRDGLADPSPTHPVATRRLLLLLLLLLLVLVLVLVLVLLV